MTQNYQFLKRIFNSKSILFFIPFFSVNLTMWGQVNGEYRSRADGAWNQTGTWQRYNGTSSSWVNNPAIPNAAVKVTIRTNHTVTWTVDNIFSVPLLILEGTGSLQVQKDLTLNINSGSVVKIAGSGTIVSLPGSKRWELDGVINFNAGSVCELTRNGTTIIPRANTWALTSTLKILNPGGSITYTNLDQSFGNVLYDRPLQDANQLGFITTQIKGDFTINSTGLWLLCVNYSYDPNVLTIGRDFTLNEGNLLLCASGGGATFLDISGNVNLYGGTILDIYTGTSGFYFVGAGQQNFVSSIVLNDETNRRFFYKATGGPSGINQIYQGTVAQETIYGYTFPSGYSPIQSSTTLLKNMTINNPAGVTLTASQTLNENLHLLNGTFTTDAPLTLTMANASTIERTGGTLITMPTFAGVVDVKYSAHTAALTTGVELPNEVTKLRDLTITNTNGIKASKSFTVNRVLNLNAANPNDTAGLLDMVIDYGTYATNQYGNGAFADNTAVFNNLNSYVLTMAEVATTIGSGDVTGKIRRTKTGGLNAGPYTFGNKNTTLQFSGGVIPTQITVVATRGLKGTHVDNGGTVAINGTTANRSTVKRMYQVMKTGGDAVSRMTLRMAYEDSELNGNPEADLITWDHHLPYGAVTPHEHGKTSASNTENYLELAGHSVAYLATEGDTAFTKYWMISKKESLSDYEWLGAVNSSWNILSNWSGSKIPNFEANVLIPSAVKTNNDPAIEATSGYSTNNATGNVLTGTGVRMRTLEINPGGILNVTGTPSPIMMYGGPNAGGGGINYSSWNNSGTFNAGSSTVVFDYNASASGSTLAGTTTFNNVTVAAGKKLELQSGSVTKISGMLTNSGTLDASTYTSTVEFLGANQTVIVPNGGTNGAYHHLTLSGNGTTILPAAMTLLGDLTVNQNSGLSFAGKTVNFTGKTPQNIQTTNGLTALTLPTIVVNNTLAGTTTSSFANLAIADLTLDSGALNVNSTNTITLNNTITRGSGVLGGTGTYEFTGPTTIVSGLFAGNRAMGGIKLNKVATFTLPNTFAINGDLTLTEGNVPLGTNSLELGGNISRTNGVLDAATGTLVFSGNMALTDQTIASGVLSGQAVANIVVKDNGKPSLSEETQLTDILTVNAGTFKSNGHLVLKSTATKTAMVAPVAINAAITGDVTVERFIPGRRGYRFFSSPVTTTTSIRQNWQENGGTTPGLGTHITGSGGSTNGFDVTGTNNPSLYTFDNANGIWNVLANTNTATIQAGIPHYLMIRGDRTVNLGLNNPPATNTVIRTKGTLFTGTTSFDLSPLAQGFSMIGNPYQAPVDMKEVVNASSNVYSTYFYVWDPTINTRGGYVSVDLATGGNNITGSFANEFLQPGQGFFIQTLDAGVAKINFQEDSKALLGSNGKVFKTVSAVSENVRLTLYENKALDTNGAAADGLVLKFNSSHSNEVNQYDARKMINQDEDFAIRNASGNFSIESRDWPVNNDAIALYIDKYRFSNYTIKADIPSLNKLKVYLHDKYTGELTELTENSTVKYKFSVSVAASKAADRFELLFKDNKSLSITDPLLSAPSGVYPNPSNGIFYYDLPQGFGTAEVKVFTVLGQEIKGFTAQINGTVFEVNLENQLSSGIYYVRFIIDGKTTVKKVIINK
jgi:hypothetical protein